MALQAMWVAGHAARLEIPGGDTIIDDRPMLNVSGIGGTDLLGIPQGPGITYRGKAGKGNWFHFSIPTPTFFRRAPGDEGFAQLVRVFVAGRFLQRSTRLDMVHVWDGDTQLPTFEGLDVAGDFRNLAATTFTLPQPRQVFRGVGLSVHISFGTENATVGFTAAGADFEVRD